MQEALHIIRAENMTARYTLSVCVIQISFVFIIIQQTKKTYWQAITFKLKLNEERTFFFFFNYIVTTKITCYIPQVNSSTECKEMILSD